MKQTLIELRELDKSVIADAGFNTLFSTIDSTIRMQANKNAKENLKIIQEDPVDIYKTPLKRANSNSFWWP
jgi:hypothetical protein